jgi:hypothetical protein
MIAASRTTVLVGGGLVGGFPGAIASGILFDATVTGIESAIH